MIGIMLIDEGRGARGEGRGSSDELEDKKLRRWEGERLGSSRPKAQGSRHKAKGATTRNIQ